MSATSPTFGGVLAEVISELDEHEAREAAADVIIRLSLAAHHTLLAQNGGKLPRPGGYLYLKVDATTQKPAPTQLDIRY